MGFMEDIKKNTGKDPLEKGYFRFKPSHGPELCLVPGYHNNIGSLAVFVDHGYDDEFDGDPLVIIPVVPFAEMLNMIASTMTDDEAN